MRVCHGSDSWYRCRRYLRARILVKRFPVASVHIVPGCERAGESVEVDAQPRPTWATAVSLAPRQVATGLLRFRVKRAELNQGNRADSHVIRFFGDHIQLRHVQVPLAGTA